MGVLACPYRFLALATPMPWQSGLAGGRSGRPRSGQPDDASLPMPLRRCPSQRRRQVPLSARRGRPPGVDKFDFALGRSSFSSCRTRCGLRIRPSPVRTRSHHHGERVAPQRKVPTGAPTPYVPPELLVDATSRARAGSLDGGCAARAGRRINTTTGSLRRSNCKPREGSRTTT